ncbi:MAG: DUF4236 domain-containing protein [Bacteroidia bacterium]
MHKIVEGILLYIRPMSIRYQRRINMGKGLGLNLSKSGVSTSYRGKWGSIGSSGFSIRTGIPGLSYRKYSGKGKNDGLVLLTILLFIGIFVLVALLLYNLFLLLQWLLAKAWLSFTQWLEKREQQAHKHDDEVIHLCINPELLAAPDAYCRLRDWLALDNQQVVIGQPLAIIDLNGKEMVLRSDYTGRFVQLALLEKPIEAKNAIYKIYPKNV